LPIERKPKSEIELMHWPGAFMTSNGLVAALIKTAALEGRMEVFIQERDLKRGMDFQGRTTLWLFEASSAASYAPVHEKSNTVPE